MIKFEKISKAQWLQDCIIHNITNVTLEPSEYDNNASPWNQQSIQII